MHDLSIRKVPGIGRVNERLLEAIGIKVSEILVDHGSHFDSTFFLFADLR
jgi:hypothetical protein